MAVLVNNSSGRVRLAQVLEAPDEHIRAEVARVVQDWVFYLASPTDNVAKEAEGRLTFYFEIEDGLGLVLTAKEKKDSGSRE